MEEELESCYRVTKRHNDLQVSFNAKIRLNARTFNFSLRPVYLPDFPVLVDHVAGDHEHVLLVDCFCWKRET